MAREKKTQKKVKDEVVTREYTINMHKRVHGIGFKKRAPRSIKEIRKFAKEKMGTNDVRVDAHLNKFLWSHGVRNVPYRVRVRLARKRNDDEEAAEKLYTYVTYVPCTSFKNTVTTKVDEE
jgi:large subunit ribosomal protein L31e